MLCKNKLFGVAALLLLSAVFASLLGSCSRPAPSTPVPSPQAQAPVVPQTASDNITTAENTTPTSHEAEIGPPVQIILVHYQGSLQRLGCCDPGFYERDEFVAIQNRSHEPQDIRGWTLKNETRGYPIFTFPTYFPCMPYKIDPDFEKEQEIAGGYSSYAEHPAHTVASMFATGLQTTSTQTGTVDWTSCTPLMPLDETPLKPAAGQQGLPAPCVLYPGQTALVFTDEIHCQYGGLSFKYGGGNIWDNEQPQVAVLYNAGGEEVSRRSYSVR